MSLNELKNKVYDSKQKLRTSELTELGGLALTFTSVMGVISPYFPKNYMVAEFAHAAQNAGAVGAVIGSSVMASALVVSTIHKNMVEKRQEKMIKQYGDEEALQKLKEIPSKHSMLTRNVWTTLTASSVAAAATLTVLNPSIWAAVGVAAVTMAGSLVSNAKNDANEEHAEKSRQEIINRLSSRIEHRRSQEEYEQKRNGAQVGRAAPSV